MTADTWVLGRHIPQGDGTYRLAIEAYSSSEVAYEAYTDDQEHYSNPPTYISGALAERTERHGPQPLFTLRDPVGKDIGGEAA